MEEGKKRQKGQRTSEEGTGTALRVLISWSCSSFSIKGPSAPHKCSIQSPLEMEIQSPPMLDLSFSQLCHPISSSLYDIWTMLGNDYGLDLESRRVQMWVPFGGGGLAAPLLLGPCKKMTMSG